MVTSSNIHTVLGNEGGVGGVGGVDLLNTDRLYHAEGAFLRPVLTRIISQQKKISLHVNDTAQHTGGLQENLSSGNKNRGQFKGKQEILNS